MTRARKSSSEPGRAHATTGRTLRWFIFLRAINVGGRRVTMDRLRAIFEELGFQATETFIASGNVVLESGAQDDAAGFAAALERRIEAHLRDRLSYDVDTFVRTRAELAAIAAARPFGPEPGGPVYVGFLGAAPAAAARDALLALGNPIDDFRVEGREVYWLARNGMGQSTFSGARLERTLGLPTTMRNLNTIERLLMKYPELQS